MTAARSRQAMHIQAKLLDQAVERGLTKPKQSFFQREIMPLFASNYYSDDSDDSSEGEEDKRNKKNKEKAKDKEKAKKAEELKKSVIASALMKREALKSTSQKI